jgi:hypothetical protein
MSVEAAGVGEDPEPGAAEGTGLGADGGAGAAEGGAVGGDASHGEDTGAAVGDQGGEALASGMEFGGVELGGLGGGAGDQVGDAQAVAAEQVLLSRGQAPRGEAGQVQGGPEPVARPGEVPAGRGRVQARVDAAEQYVQRLPWARQHVGNGSVRGRGQVRGTRTRRPRTRRLHCHPP